MESYRGYRRRRRSNAKRRAGRLCDYWVPDPGFRASSSMRAQHFTSPRRLALSVYADAHVLGFSARRWLVWTSANSTMRGYNDPPFRDENGPGTTHCGISSRRSWNLRPTVRLYARDRVRCSLDPDSREDRERFSDLKQQGSALGIRRTPVGIRSPGHATGIDPGRGDGVSSSRPKSLGERRSADRCRCPTAGRTGKSIHSPARTSTSPLFPEELHLGVRPGTLRITDQAVPHELERGTARRVRGAGRGNVAILVGADRQNRRLH